MCRCFYKCLEPELSSTQLRNATFALAVTYFHNHNCEVPVRKVALLFGLDPSSLLRRIQGKVKSSSHGGQNRILTTIQEAAIMLQNTFTISTK
jgi:hypothetical protein